MHLVRPSVCLSVKYGNSSSKKLKTKIGADIPRSRNNPFKISNVKIAVRKKSRIWRIPCVLTAFTVSNSLSPADSQFTPTTRLNFLSWWVALSQCRRCELAMKCSTAKQTPACHVGTVHLTLFKLASLLCSTHRMRTARLMLLTTFTISVSISLVSIGRQPCDAAANYCKLIVPRVHAQRTSFCLALIPLASISGRSVCK